MGLAPSRVAARVVSAAVAPPEPLAGPVMGTLLPAEQDMQLKRRLAELQAKVTGRGLV
jgi:hypothetical protein